MKLDMGEILTRSVSGTPCNFHINFLKSFENLTKKEPQTSICSASFTVVYRKYYISTPVHYGYGAILCKENVTTGSEDISYKRLV